MGSIGAESSFLCILLGHEADLLVRRSCNAELNFWFQLSVVGYYSAWMLLYDELQGGIAPTSTGELRGGAAVTTVPASGGIPGQFVCAAEPSARQPGLRILLVDDNALNLSAGQAMMSRFGHHIDTAAGGVEAIDAIQSRTYDLVLMDVRMPGMDGPETAHRIRRLPMRQPRIIALTASASAKDRSACRNAGMDGYLLKPLRPPAMVELLVKEQQLAGGAAPETPDSHVKMFAHGR